METKVVSYVDPKTGDEIFRVIVGEETAIARMRRAALRAAAAKIENEDMETRALRTAFYPDCIASVIDWCSVKKPTFEEFTMLPADLIDVWTDAAWEMIPTWQPHFESDETPEEAEKKVQS